MGGQMLPQPFIVYHFVHMDQDRFFWFDPLNPRKGLFQVGV
jgi:hypothetical protein